ncbi:MAG: DUF7684 family protein [Planctomycetota bacterium]
MIGTERVIFERFTRSSLPGAAKSDVLTIFIHDPTDQFDDSQRQMVSNWLIVNNCKYMCAWGPNSTKWDTSVNLADVGRADFDDSDDMCITTWHDDEDLEESLEFFINLAWDPYAKIQDKVIIDIPRHHIPSQWEKMANKAVNRTP